MQSPLKRINTVILILIEVFFLLSWDLICPSSGTWQLLWFVLGSKIHEEFIQQQILLARAVEAQCPAPNSEDLI